MKLPLLAASAAFAAVLPTASFAWGNEGHVLVAAIARNRLTPATRAKVDAILAKDHDSLTQPDMLSRSVWADAWRAAGHRETAQWHYADIELDRPDMDAACFGHPPSPHHASAGPEQACVIDRVADFARELGDPATKREERALALKYVLHFVGDLHQPLHLADNHDRGGNCVVISLGGLRTVNLHSYWDTVVVGELGDSGQSILARLTSDITPKRASEWSQADIAAWAKETHEIAVSVAYAFATPAGCNSGRGPIKPPADYDARAQDAAATQLGRAGVRLAVILEKALAPLDLASL